MKIYLVSRNDDVGYDEYDSAVVVAETPEAAINMLKEKHGISSHYLWKGFDVSVTEIIPSNEGVILESFNAG